MHELLQIGFPLGIAASGGFALWLTLHALRARRVLPALLASIAIATSIIVLYMTQDQDPRDPPSLPLYIVAAAVAVVLATCTARRLRNPRGTFGALIALISIIATPLLLLGNVFTMSVLEDKAVPSPDGRYTAHLIYYDGLTFGYYFVAIKPDRPWSCLLGMDEVAEADAEGFDDIRWGDNHTLIVRYDAGSGFAQRDTHWRDIQVRYEAVPDSTPPHK